VRDGTHHAPGIALGLATLRDRAAGYLAVTKPRIVALIVFTAIERMQKHKKEEKEEKNEE
jgi:heme O synthase-like polyprenyltransferase